MHKALFILLFFISCAGNKDEEKKRMSNPNFHPSLRPFNEITKDGDIVLKAGYGAISKMIIDELGEEIKISHCGIIYKKEGTAFIIHSISGEFGNLDGVQTISFEKFNDDTKPNSLFILRYKDSSKHQLISENAKFTLGQNIPFDHDFDLSNSDKLYCSEFVENVLKKATKKSYFDTKKINKKDVYIFNSIIKNDDFILVNQKN